MVEPCFPRSLERGFVEAGVNHAPAPCSYAFRARLSAASLKQVFMELMNASTRPFPRSLERGFVEAG